MPRLKDISGKTFGHLTVLHRDPTPTPRVRWVCQCACGTEKSVASNNLQSGGIKSCGCKRAEERSARMQGNRLGGLVWKDLTGKVIGDLTVVRRSASRGKKTYWACRCTCGTSVEVSYDNLSREKTKSCGCRRVVEGQRRAKDHTGEVWGRLTVLGPSEPEGRALMWRCRCACGSEVSVSSSRLTPNGTRSCGCLRVEADGVYSILRAERGDFDDASPSYLYVFRLMKGDEEVGAKVGISNTPKRRVRQLQRGLIGLTAGVVWTQRLPLKDAVLVEQSALSALRLTSEGVEAVTGEGRTECFQVTTDEVIDTVQLILEEYNNDC